MFSVSGLFRPLFCKVASPTAGDGLHACLSATVVQDPLAYFSVCKWTEAKHCEGCQHMVCSPGSSVGKAHLTGCSNHSKQSCQVHENSSMGPLSVLVVLTLQACHLVMRGISKKMLWQFMMGPGCSRTFMK